jgi:catechol 2,3-dioxygenase-like lactoylglutathione lyase family enzyme
VSLGSGRRADAEAGAGAEARRDAGNGTGIGAIGIDHVQLAMPPRGEADARRFYGALLGLREIEKPAALAERGGCWFVGPGGTAIHLGVDQRFIAARKAHPCLIVADLDIARATLSAGGAPIVDDDADAGLARCYTADPFGNRIELVDARDAGFTERR